MAGTKLIPYTVFLPEDQYLEVRKFAKERKASGLIRGAVDMMLKGTNLYNSGYNKGLADAAKVVYDCEEAQMIAIRGKDLGALLAEKIDLLEVK